MSRFVDPNREPLAIGFAVLVLWSELVDWLASTYAAGLSEVAVFAVFSIGAAGIGHVTRRFTWADEGVQREKAKTAAAVRRRNQSAAPTLFKE